MSATRSGIIKAIGELKLWFRYLLKNWVVIIGIGMLAGLLGILYAWVQKPVYESRLTFALEEDNDGLGGALSLAAEFGFNLGGGKSIFSGENILAIITSRRIIEEVLLSTDSGDTKHPVRTFAQYLLDLKRDSTKATAKDKMKEVHFPVNKPKETFSYLEDSVLFVLYKDAILSNLTATRPDKKLSVYEVKLRAPEERFALEFTRRLMDATKTMYTQIRSSKSKQTLEILEQRVAMMKGSLNSAIAGRASSQDANLNPAFSTVQTPVQQRQVDISVYGGAYTELFKNLELARYQYLKDVPLLQVIDNADYPLKRIKKGRLLTGIIFSLIAGILVISFYSARFYLRDINDASNDVV